VILAAIAIIATIAVPKFIDFNERANEELLDAKIFELTGKILNQQKMAKI
jgi:hypothetical protein